MKDNQKYLKGILGVFLNEKFIKLIRDLVLEYPEISRMNDDKLKELIEELIDEQVDGVYISISEKIDIVDHVYSSIRGLGHLDIILKDDEITEVMINSFDEVFVEKNGKVEKLNVKFVDTRLPDGSRVNVVLPPIALKGPTVTIRKFSKKPMTVEQLIKYGSINKEIADKLETLVRAKYNIFISGGTGSGKTTFLNAMSNFIPRNERIITIEDSAELQISNIENLVRLETRNANTSGAGEITIRDLIKSSLRMRPERIVVGEVRGAEAIDMLQAMNTGHDGSLSTGHANSTKDMLSRLETMVLMGASGLPLEAIRNQIASAIDIIIHLSRLRDHSRKVVEIVEVVGMKDGEIELNTLYEFIESAESTTDKVVGSLERTNNPLINNHKMKLMGVKEEF